MKLESSLPRLQVPATCPYPEPDNPIHSQPSHFLKIHLNIILPSTPGSPKWSFCLRFPHQNPCTRLSSPPYTLNAPPIHSSLPNFGNRYAKVWILANSQIRRGSNFIGTVKDFSSAPEGGSLCALYILPFTLNQPSFLTTLLLGGVYCYARLFTMFVNWNAR